MAKFCPLCMNEDHTRAIDDSDPARPVWGCTHDSHGPEGFTWVATEPKKSAPRQRPATTSRDDPPVTDIGDKLLACIPPGITYTPYGLVEDRFFELWPEDADALLDRYGHMWRRDGQRTGDYTMSKYLAHRLSNLERQGFAEHIEGATDPRWPHLSTISHWRLPQ